MKVKIYARFDGGDMKALRTGMGLTRKELATKTGFSLAAINRFEKGVKRVTFLDSLKFCEVFECGLWTKLHRTK